jgi:ribosome-binding factor A
VKVTRDLRHARVFVSVLGDDAERSSTMEGLRSATPFLRSELGRQMRLRYLPELVFELDRSPEVAQRVEQLLKKLHEQEDSGSF